MRNNKFQVVPWAPWVIMFSACTIACTPSGIGFICDLCGGATY